LNTGEALALLERALASGRAQVAAMPVEWPKFFRADPAATLAPILRDLALRHAAPASDRQENRIAQALAAAPANAHGSVLAEELRGLLGAVLRLPAEEIPSDVPLAELGVDSLLAIEIKNRLRREADLDLPLTELLRGPTLAALTETLLPAAKAAALAHAAPAAGPMEEIEL
jgi:aryl carrier-like protein